jgi:cell division protein ZapA (FtsZ GTPase activity inhibitor)
MGEISIKINIADRVYPLKINSEDEENVRKAAKLVNDRLKEFQENYAVRDKQDLLSMCVLQIATEHLNLDRQQSTTSLTVTQKIEQIDKKLTEFLFKQ